MNLAKMNCRGQHVQVELWQRPRTFFSLFLDLDF